jgi:hypothetical protein
MMVRRKMVFSYWQFVVFDASETESPPLDLTFDQGFSRLTHAAAFRTIIQDGTADLSVILGKPMGQYDRVISVPIHVISGAVLIEGPEEVGETTPIQIAVGWYRVIASQRIANSDNENQQGIDEEVTIGFVPCEPDEEPRILVQDADIK